MALQNYEALLWIKMKVKTEESQICREIAPLLGWFSWLLRISKALTGMHM